MKQFGNLCAFRLLFGVFALLVDSCFWPTAAFRRSRGVKKVFSDVDRRRVGQRAPQQQQQQHEKTKKTLRLASTSGEAIERAKAAACWRSKLRRRVGGGSGQLANTRRRTRVFYVDHEHKSDAPAASAKTERKRRPRRHLRAAIRRRRISRQ